MRRLDKGHHLKDNRNRFRTVAGRTEEIFGATEPGITFTVAWGNTAILLYENISAWFAHSRSTKRMNIQREKRSNEASEKGEAERSVQVASVDYDKNRELL